jgi:S-adenosylmethionine hydrolase
VTERPRFVSFLTDFGRADEFVGVCHAVMLDLAPDLRIIDLTHDIPPFDVRAGALSLVRAAQYLPSGIVLAVVDPGVGTARRLVAIEVDGGFFVGPDNGLLAPAVAMAGGPRRIVSLTNRAYQLDPPGPTFAARDIMSPACGHLASGVDLGELGEPVDPAAMVPGIVPLPDEIESGYRAEVLWVDRFGNCQLNVGPDDLALHGLALGATLEVEIGDRARRVRWAHTYGDAKPSELVLVVDSYGLCSLALDRASAAQECGLRAGSSVRLTWESSEATREQG